MYAQECQQPSRVTTSYFVASCFEGTVNLPVMAVPQAARTARALDLLYHETVLGNDTETAYAAVNAVLQRAAYDQASFSNLLPPSADPGSPAHLAAALARHGLALSPGRRTPGTSAAGHGDEAHAYLLRNCHAWVALRRVGAHWVNLNHLMRRPAQMPAAHLSSGLIHLEEEGYVIFAVVGDLPECVADGDSVFDVHFEWGLSGGLFAPSENPGCAPTASYMRRRRRLMRSTAGPADGPLGDHDDGNDDDDDDDDDIAGDDYDNFGAGASGPSFLHGDNIESHLESSTGIIDEEEDIYRDHRYDVRPGYVDEYQHLVGEEEENLQAALVASLDGRAGASDFATEAARATCNYSEDDAVQAAIAASLETPSGPLHENVGTMLDKKPVCQAGKRAAADKNDVAAVPSSSDLIQKTPSAQSGAAACDTTTGITDSGQGNSSASAA